MTTTNSARSAHGRAPAAPPSEALKDGKDPLSIGLQARSQLVAVALDTNALDRGRPHLDKLRNLAARLKVIGLPLWVPESVARSGPSTSPRNGRLNSARRVRCIGDSAKRACR